MKPNPVIARQGSYHVPRHGAPIDLKLDSNEGPLPPVGLLAALESAELLRRYPDARALERKLAARLGVGPDCVLTTCGADDALARACQALLWPGRELVLPVPTFEMLPRYAALAGATVREVPWPTGAYPVDAVLRELNANTGAVALVTPNNPTGAAITAGELRRVAEAAGDAALFVDLAYAEFADEDLTHTALAYENALVFRTLSKAWGLAGLRVGYVIAQPLVIDWLRGTGQPYAVSSPAVALAMRWLDEGEPHMRRHVAQVKIERTRLGERLERLGCVAHPSQANFVLARPRDAEWFCDGLAGLGIAVRIWPGHGKLDGMARITCPSDEPAFARLSAALDAVLAPEALLFDMDGVLADVRGSYREAIIATAASFGAVVTHEDVARKKAAGDANNDWHLTHALLLEHGVTAAFADVKARFELLYQGDETQGIAGLHEQETLLCARELLERLAARLPLGIVTGRPRADAERFLARFELAPLFKTLVCMEDAPLKPSPEPVLRALALLNVSSAWLVGDTRDDVLAARAAGVVPLGYNGDGLVAAGAGRLLSTLDELERLTSLRGAGSTRL
ncbi:MAG: TIGR01548 family HAD-type hydrolase [Myxococcales bacterium]|nr:TIGR01548 family HAD-type hydrolase [Myxococcales bacterium]